MALCRHFGECGGCSFQDIEYQAQLNKKQADIEALFGLPVEPIVPCDPPWRYRNKMEYTFSMDLKGERYLGLIKKGSRGRVLNLLECYLVSDWFQTTLNVVRNWWEDTGLLAFHPYKNTGTLRTLTVREGMRTGDRMIILTVSGNPDWAIKKDQLDSFVEILKEALIDKNEEKNLSIFLKIHQAIKGKPTEFFEMHLSGPDIYREKMTVGRPLEFHVSPSAFFQPNPAQAEKFYKIASSLLKIPEGGVVWDLYCGTGTLAIAVAPIAKEVLGIELSPESSLDARTNVKLNGLANVKIITGDVGEALESGNYPSPDAILVDPPRAGLDKKAMGHIIKAKAPKIVYIACNPKTQFENCQEFIQAGYRIVSIHPVDQFPHTPHVENVILLELSE